MALSKADPTCPIEGARPASLTFWLKAQDVNWQQRSECTIDPDPGNLAAVAMPRALVTSAASWRVSIDQPTTFRAKASSTTQ